MIIDPNHQPDPPSNQPEDEDENEFGLSDREILQIILNDLLEAIPVALETYRWFQGANANQAHNRLRECYTAYLNLSKKLEEM